MINGFVSNLEAIIPLEIKSSVGTQQLSAIIDTGYNGHLTLPPSTIHSLGLVSAGQLRGMLADGTIILMDTYIAEIQWLGNRRKVVVTKTEGSPLVGMALLEGKRIDIEVYEGGRVLVE